MEFEHKNYFSFSNEHVLYLLPSLSPAYFISAAIDLRAKVQIWRQQMLLAHGYALMLNPLEPFYLFDVSKVEQIKVDDHIKTMNPELLVPHDTILTDVAVEENLMERVGSILEINREIERRKAPISPSMVEPGPNQVPIFQFERVGTNIFVIRGI